MPKIASIFRSSLCLAVVLTVALPAMEAAALECADKEISARGPTFTQSPETSMEAAKTEWLKKATEMNDTGAVQVLVNAATHMKTTTGP